MGSDKTSEVRGHWSIFALVGKHQGSKSDAAASGESAPLGRTERTLKAQKPGYKKETYHLSTEGTCKHHTEWRRESNPQPQRYKAHQDKYNAYD